jgi:hypothetical protein
MDIFIAVCISLVIGLIVGFAIAWYMQKTRLEEGYNKWREVKMVNQYGRRIDVPVAQVTRIKGTAKYQIYAEWQNPIKRREKYPFSRTFLLTDNSPTITYRLGSLSSVPLIVYFDEDTQNYWYWMERPW